MQIVGIPFQTVDWATIAPTEHLGVTGVASWQTVEVGNVRVRLVRYSAGYLADHWCARGHVIHVLEGVLLTELRDGRTFETVAGATYLVANDDGEHRSTTVGGALLFVVD